MLFLLAGVSVCLADVILQNRVGTTAEKEGENSPKAVSLELRTPVRSWGYGPGLHPG